MFDEPGVPLARQTNVLAAILGLKNVSGVTPAF
jgi:hypothetical protein